MIYILAIALFVLVLFVLIGAMSGYSVSSTDRMSDEEEAQAHDEVL